ncbi:MAG: winged helix-turn-helix transcriptional regulator [Elusimicrobia bacterium]|nr:winged helix-turn-helix transcriptional regulator [Elusimicrobiota bacterium]
MGRYSPPAPAEFTLALSNDARHCDPPVTIHMAVFKYQGHDLLMVDVPEGRHKPHGCAAGYFLRAGPNSQKLNRDELIEFVRALKPAIPERQDCPDFRYPADFDGRGFRSFLRLSGISAPGLSMEKLLVNLGLARREGRRLAVNNAGVLFFAKQPARFLPQARVTCVLFQTPERSRILDRQDLDGGLLDNLRQAEIFLLKHLPVRYEIRGFDRIEHPELPVEALREGVVNALMHRDYSVRGGNVFVEIFPDRVALVNPGGLPPGLAPEDFGTKSVHRNPLVADLLFRARKVERVGTGIRRIRELLAASRCPEPRFDFTSFFELSLPRSVSGGGQVEGGKSGASTTRRTTALGKVTVKVLEKVTVKVLEKVTANQARILSEATANPRITAKELAIILGISERKVRANINKLKVRALMKRVGPDKGGHWEVSV